MSIKHNVFKKEESLLKYYEIQSNELRMKHSAIWLEVKHYTWVLSFLIGTGPIALVTGKVNESSHLLLLFILATVGTLISILAYCIIKKDLTYFLTADARLLYLEKKLGVVNKTKYVDKRLEKANSDDFTVLSYLESEKRPWYYLNKIRNLIPFTFILYFLGGSAMSIYYFNEMIKCT